MNAIQITDLKKYYGTVKAVDGLTLTVENGSVFGFLGPNGAGKTTTLRMLTGLAKPTGGNAEVAGVPIRDRQELTRRIGYLPEDPSFYGWMTPAEFLDHVGRVFGLSAKERKERVTELLELVDLEYVRKRHIAGFSRGMRQRLGLAQALINHPEVLFLDEPVSALDPAGRKEVLDLIESLRGGTTVFMSTHILADVERVCDTVAIINAGRLIVEAPQTELLERYSIPAIELEVEPAQGNGFKGWVEGLKDQSWVSSLSMNGSSARLVVKDYDLARRQILASAVQNQIPIRRYEIVRPTLEDIFLRLVGQEASQ